MKKRIFAFFTVLFLLQLTLSVTVNAQAIKRVTNSKVSAKDAVNQRRTLQTALNEAGAPYSVGDFAHGGIVIYVDNTGEHGLVCAKTDQSSSTAWSLSNFTVVGSSGEGIYSGQQNTLAIVNKIGQTGNAAAICNNLVVTESGKNYSDWYLPSKTELNLISQNYALINSTAKEHGGTELKVGIYWSSTERDGTMAYGQFCYDLNQSETRLGKESKSLVRAVRRF